MVFALVTLKMHHVILAANLDIAEKASQYIFFSIVGLREILCISTIFHSLREVSLMGLELPYGHVMTFSGLRNFSKYAGMYV